MKEKVDMDLRGLDYGEIVNPAESSSHWCSESRCAKTHPGGQSHPQVIKMPSCQQWLHLSTSPAVLQPRTEQIMNASTTENSPQHMHHYLLLKEITETLENFLGFTWSHMLTVTEEGPVSCTAVSHQGSYRYFGFTLEQLSIYQLWCCKFEAMPQCVVGDIP